MTRVSDPYYEQDGITIYHGDCRDILPQFPDKSFDLVLTDPPYGMTMNEWDSPIDIIGWWDSMKRLSGVVILTASQPFTSKVVVCNEAWYRHEWIWQKNRGSNFANTVREPFKEHESVLLFAKNRWKYQPQKQTRNGSGAERANYKVGWNPGGSNYREFAEREPVEITEDRVPSSIQKFNTEVGLHPTQKPVALLSYLYLTYSDVGDSILDPFMGSGTTLVAAKQLGRKAVGIEIEEKYCEIAVKRLAQMELFGRPIEATQ